MTYRKLPKNLPDLLRAAGLKVVVVGDWYNNGRPASTGEYYPVGPLNHHTGAFDRIGDLADDLAYAKWLFYGEPRNGLPKPLCAMALSAEGTVYLGAAGRTNHAGVAKAMGSVAAGDGNALYTGIEWMLSGNQPIPAKMMKAGATLNAVLLRVFKTSVQTVGCHYQTSVTGKWDIGDPNGIPFRGFKVLNVPKFRALVQAEKDRLDGPPPTTLKTATVTMIQASMQTQDTSAQQAKDAADLFGLAIDRKAWWVSGTEANNKVEAAIYRKAAEAEGLRFFNPGSDPWVALNPKRFPGRVSADWTKIFDGEAGRSTAKGVCRVTATNPVILGKTTILVSHFYTLKNPQQQQKNLLLANEVGRQARLYGAGRGKVFYGGDQNEHDKVLDTFHGAPLTSLQDELRKWEGTLGSRTIDVLATYDGDTRVKAKSIEVLTDAEFPQFTDHHIVIGQVAVKYEAA